MVLIFWSRLRPQLSPHGQRAGLTDSHPDAASGSAWLRSQPGGAADKCLGLLSGVLLPLAPASPGLRHSQTAKLRQTTCQGHRETWVGREKESIPWGFRRVLSPLPVTAALSQSGGWVTRGCQRPPPALHCLAR